MTIVAGFVEESDLGSLHNSAAVFQDGEIVHVHRKIYLPTYGLFQEERFLGRGRRLGLVPLAGSPVGVLICEDLWHPELARRLARGGARLLVVPSAGPGRVGPGPVPESSESWEVVTRAAALYNTCWVVYCNRVGWEEGSFYAGGSHVVRPGGEIMARAPFVDEHLLVADIDLRDADRLRWRLPLLEDERTDVEGPA
jgi:predicted amidohydrolase